MTGLQPSLKSIARARSACAVAFAMLLAVALLGLWPLASAAWLLVVLPIAAGAVVVFRALGSLDRDVSQAKSELADLEAHSCRFQSLIAHSSEALTIIDRDGRIGFASPSSALLFDRSPEGLNGSRFPELADEDERARLRAFVAAGQDGALEFRVSYRDGQERYVETHLTNLLDDPHVRGILLSSRDVTEHRVLEERLKHQAFHDPLTGLANRVLFRDRLEHALARANRRSEALALFFIDLDDFKQVNDQYGHLAGDVALQKVASRLQSCLREADTAARLGGDEFAVVLEGVSQLSDIEVVAERILAALSASMRLHEVEHDFSASIGIAISTGTGSVDQLIDAADRAMYEAKARGKNQVVIAGPRTSRDGGREHAVHAP